MCVWIEGYCVCGRGRGCGRGSAWKRDQWACHVAQSIDEFEVLKGVGDAGGWGAEWACRGASRVTGQPLNVAITHRQGLQPAHTHSYSFPIYIPSVSIYAAALHRHTSRIASPAAAMQCVRLSLCHQIIMPDYLVVNVCHFTCAIYGITLPRERGVGGKGDCNYIASEATSKPNWTLPYNLFDFRSSKYCTITFHFWYAENMYGSTVV